MKLDEFGSEENEASQKWQDPLSLRIAECPGCKHKHMVNVDDLQQHIQCICEISFHLAQHVVTDEFTTMDNCYSTWKCPRCSKLLLIPRFAIDLPAVCPCGQAHPTSNCTGTTRRYILDEMNDAFIGNDPLLYENMLIPLRAAKRYNYEITEIGNETYSVRNPTKGTIYTVEISDDFIDECECDVFQAGAGTCIHVEHVRLKTGKPSTASFIAESKVLAYAWFDKSTLPTRIRIGWLGEIEHQVQSIVQLHGAITTRECLESLRVEFENIGIPFSSLSSAKQALIPGMPINTDNGLAERIFLQGRSYLANRIPYLHQFQIEGSLFLARAQRALLFDEMGLGKTVQAIAAACVLQEFAGITSCLILAPKSVLHHWRSEVLRFSGMECTIVDGSEYVRKKLYSNDSFFKATTLESFRRDFPNVGHHDLIVIDEIQKARSIKSISNRVLREVEAKFLFGLSGTAIESGLSDLLGIMRIIRPSYLESQLAFYASHIVCDRFGKPQHTLHPEFFYVRHAGRILRRLKIETEVKIPGIQFQEVNLPLTGLQKEMAQPLIIEMEELKQRIKLRYDLNDFTRNRWLINRIVELSNSSTLIDSTTDSSSKIEWLEKFLSEQCCVNNEKVVIFTRWTRMQKIIMRLCNKMGISYASLNGQNTIEEREKAVRRFTGDDDVMVFVSTDAGGIGVNLQCARIIVNFEPGWNPATDAQRIQRVHRIGQRREVQAYLPLTPLDYMFTLATHPKKAFPSDRIDAARQVTSGESIQTWEELLPVIEWLKQKPEKELKKIE